MDMRQNCTSPAEQLRNIKDVFRDNLSLFVGAGRRFEAEAVASACNKSAATIHSYLRGETVPDLPTAIMIMAVLPPEYAAAVLRPAGLVGLHRVDGSSTAMETAREVSEGLNELLKALSSGRINHTHLPGLRKELTEAMVAIAQFLAQMGGEAP